MIRGTPGYMSPEQLRADRVERGQDRLPLYGFLWFRRNVVS